MERRINMAKKNLNPTTVTSLPGQPKVPPLKSPKQIVDQLRRQNDKLLSNKKGK
jgi:hypothetical protein